MSDQIVIIDNGESVTVKHFDLTVKLNNKPESELGAIALELAREVNRLRDENHWFKTQIFIVKNYVKILDSATVD